MVFWSLSYPSWCISLMWTWLHFGTIYYMLPQTISPHGSGQYSGMMMFGKHTAKLWWNANLIFQGHSTLHHRILAYMWTHGTSAPNTSHGCTVSIRAFCMAFFLIMSGKTFANLSLAFTSWVNTVSSYQNSSKYKSSSSNRKMNTSSYFISGRLTRFTLSGLVYTLHAILLLKLPELAYQSHHHNGPWNILSAISPLTALRFLFKSRTAGNSEMSSQCFESYDSITTQWWLSRISSMQ